MYLSELAFVSWCMCMRIVQCKWALDSRLAVARAAVFPGVPCFLALRKTLGAGTLRLRLP